MTIRTNLSNINAPQTAGNRRFKISDVSFCHDNQFERCPDVEFIKLRYCFSELDDDAEWSAAFTEITAGAIHL